VLSSNDEKYSRKLVLKRSLALIQPILKKQKCSQTVTVPIQFFPPVDSLTKRNQCVRTVTVPIEDDGVAIKHIVAPIPLEHATSIEKGVSQLKPIQVQEYAIIMMKKKLETIYASFKNDKNDQHDNPDYDSDNPMYDDCYSDVVDSITSKNAP